MYLRYFLIRHSETTLFFIYALAPAQTCAVQLSTVRMKLKLNMLKAAFKRLTIKLEKNPRVLKDCQKSSSRT